MGKASTVIGLTLVALGSVARAQDSVPASPPPPVVAAPAPVTVVPAPAGLVEAPARIPATYPARRLDLGLSVLGMGFGQITTYTGVESPAESAELAYGFSISVNYRLLAGLSLGIAPQALYNVKSKSAVTGVGATEAAKEYDLMGRIAYTQPLVETVAVYAEALPGYSLRSGSKWSTGFVLALGGGVTMGLTERVFTSIGVGYQLGYQKLKLGTNAVYPNGEDYLRVTLGGGVRF